MTNLQILAAASSAFFGVVVPPTPTPAPNPNPDPPSPGLSIPAAIDATAGSMRPAGRSLGTLTVSATNPAANHTTIAAAITAAKALQVAAGKQDSVAWNSTAVDIGPDYRVDIVIGAGTYNEGHIGGSPWINLYGATGNKADVVITGAGASSGVLHAFGPCYSEGITFKATDSGPKYPVHLGAEHTLTFVNCKLEATSAAGDGGGAAIGMDGADGTNVTLYKTEFVAAPGATWVANMHSASGNTVPLQLSVIGCTLNNVFTYSDLGTHLADEVYFIGNTGGSLSASGTNVVTHTSGTWPTPTPYSAADQAFFYPSRIGEAHTLTGQTVGDAAAFTPPANRIYLIPVPIPASIHATHYGVTAAASGGTWTGWMGRLPATPTGAPAITPATAIPSAGLKQGKHFYYYDFHPGETRGWVALTFSAGVSVMGSVSLAGLIDCYYSDDGGGTVAHAAAGTAIPLAQLRSAA